MNRLDKLKILTVLSLIAIYVISPIQATQVPNIFNNGDIADANDVNANFAALAAGDNIIKYQMVSADTTLGDSSRVMAINNTGDIVLTLPDANTVPGRVYKIQKLLSNYNVEIGVASGNIAEPYSEVRIRNQGKAELFSDGTTWHLLKGTGGSGDLIHPLGKGFGIVTDIYANGSSSPEHMAELNGKVYFQAYDNINGTELWCSDGTAVGTVLVKDIYAGSGGSSPQYLHTVGSVIYFSAQDATNGRELWKTDGTSAGTVLVKDIYPGSGSSSPRYFGSNGSSVYFQAYTVSEGNEPWVSDGTSVGTSLLLDVNPGSANSNPREFTALGAQVLFRSGNTTHGDELFVSDGTSAGTSVLKDIYAGSSGSYPEYLVNMGSFVYFRAQDGVIGYELWKSDGTEVGTSLVKDINPSTPGSSPYELTVIDGNLYFSANDGTTGTEPWISDGTSAGTQLLFEMNAGSSGSDPYSFVKAGSNIIVYDDNNYGIHVWNGTTSVNLGPYYVYSLYNQNLERSQYLLPFKDGVLFVGYLSNSNNSHENIWYTDGTVNGTVQLTNEENIDVDYWQKVGDKIYFNLENYNYGAWGEELYIIGGETAPTEPPFGNVSGED